jgi:hypothetical protein
VSSPGRSSRKQRAVQDKLSRLYHKFQFERQLGHSDQMQELGLKINGVAEQRPRPKGK